VFVACCCAAVPCVGIVSCNSPATTSYGVRPPTRPQRSRCFRFIHRLQGLHGTTHRGPGHSVLSLVDSLSNLPLPSQDNFLVLQNSMVLCLGYLACTAPIQRAVGALKGSTDQVHNSVATAVQRSCTMLPQA
jgi:hypothetical protein